MFYLQMDYIWTRRRSRSRSPSRIDITRGRSPSWENGRLQRFRSRSPSWRNESLHRERFPSPPWRDGRLQRQRSPSPFPRNGSQKRERVPSPSWENGSLKNLRLPTTVWRDERLQRQRSFSPLLRNGNHEIERAPSPSWDNQSLNNVRLPTTTWRDERLEQRQRSLSPLPRNRSHERERVPLSSWRDEVTINRMNDVPRRRGAILRSDRPENERTIPDVIDSHFDRKDTLSDFPGKGDIISTTKENTERRMHEALINDRSSNQGNRRIRDRKRERRNRGRRNNVMAEYEDKEMTMTSPSQKVGSDLRLNLTRTRTTPSPREEGRTDHAEVGSYISRMHDLIDKELEKLPPRNAMEKFDSKLTSIPSNNLRGPDPFINENQDLKYRPSRHKREEIKSNMRSAHEDNRRYDDKRYVRDITQSGNFPSKRNSKSIHEPSGLYGHRGRDPILKEDNIIINRENSQLDLKCNPPKRSEYQELYECPIAGCLVRTDNLRLHTLRKHVPEIMWSVEESDQQCQKDLAPQRASLLRAIAMAILGPQGTLSQLVDLVNGIGVPVPVPGDNLTSSHWAMVEVCRHQKWTVPKAFSLNPLNSPAAMIHWRVQSILMGLLPEDRRQSFMSVFRIADPSKSSVAKSILDVAPQPSLGYRDQF